MGAMLRALERFLLPNVCVACERPGGTGEADWLFCTLCRARLRGLGPGCMRCRQPLPPVGPCRFCADWPEALRWVHSAVWLGEEARALLHHLKYQGYIALAEAAADLIVRTVPRRPHGVLCPIPLGRRRLGRRGYNQAQLIAVALARRWAAPLVPSLLRRVRETRSQTALDPAQRKANVAGAFSATVPPPRRARMEHGAASGNGGGAAVILVDDVLTTGATIAAAAGALERQGWGAVWAVTFARALPFVRRAVIA